MAKGEKFTPEQVHAMEEAILERGEQVIHEITEYMRVLGMTGIKAPTPPRPKREAVLRLAYASLLLDLAFKEMSAPRGE